MLRAGLSLRAGGASAAGAKLTVARAAGTSSIRVFSSRQQRPLVRKDSEIMLARSESIEAELAESQSGLSLMLVDQHARAIDEVVPWFLYNMPRAYFRQVPRELQEEHLRAFAAFKSSWRDSRNDPQVARWHTHFHARGKLPRDASRDDQPDGIDARLGEQAPPLLGERV